MPDLLCPDDHELLPLLADESGCAQVRGHLAGCPSCRQRLERLQAEVANLRQAVAWLPASIPSGVYRECHDAAATILAERRLQTAQETPRQGLGEVATSVTQSWPQVQGYEILEELGRGGMGVVYKARQVGLNRLVALKMILEGSHADAERLARFRREVEAIACLQHPHIVQIHEIGEQAGRPFFSMELMAGGSLADHLDGTPLNPRVAARLVETLARAVHAAHQQGIIHRDLKPANILLASVVLSPGSVTKETDYGLRTTDYGLFPKISDFSLAKQIAHADVKASDPQRAAQTRSGTVLGTPSYMAPEQAQAKPAAVSLAADIYGLGAILYELLSGRPPFKAETAFETVLQVLHEEPVPPRRMQPKLPRDLETICLTCLRKEPQHRYHSALALAEDLRRFQTGEPIRARPTGVVERGLRWARRRPALAALLAVSVVACVALVIVDQRNQGELVHALQQANAQRQRADANSEEANTQRQRADANYVDAILLVLDFANQLSQMEKYAEAVAMLNRAIDKQETMLQGEQNPERRQILAGALQESYGIRAMQYVLMGRYPEARADLERLPEDYAAPLADLYRSLLAKTLAQLGKYREATTKADTLAAKAGLDGNVLAQLASAYAWSIPAVQQDPNVSITEKDRLREHYGVRAVAMLQRARIAGLFADPALLQELRTDKDLDSLRSRADFKKLLAELEAAAATAKPLAGSSPRAPTP